MYYFFASTAPWYVCKMKLVDAVHKIYEVLAGANTARAYRLLLLQRQLLYSGIEVSAEVMDILLMEKTIGAMHLIRLWIKLKKTDGSFIYTHTEALVELNSIPQKGQWLRIKYFPENLSSVLVL